MTEPLDTKQALLAEIEILRAQVAASEQAVAEANQRLDEFLSIVSHELRTPLTAINGNVQLAKRRLSALIIADGIDEEILEVLDVILELLSRAENQVRIQNRLVSDLLDASRIQANKLEIHPEECDLLAIVRKTVDDIQTINPLRTIVLDLPPSENAESIAIVADPQRVSQVLTNYISNALKYSESEQPVTVHVAVKDQLVYVYVTDHGPGIPPEIVAHIWQRFYKSTRVKAQNGPRAGLGIGLYISKLLIEQQRGNVGVESTPGEGSTFWFALPVKQ